MELQAVAGGPHERLIEQAEEEPPQIDHFERYDVRIPKRFKLGIWSTIGIVVNRIIGSLHLETRITTD
jgi:hypothetical protein